MVSAGLVPSEGREGGVAPGLSPWLVDGHLHLPPAFFSCGLCPNFPFVQGHQSLLD